MRRAAIVSPLRTAVGAFGGALRPLKMEDLGTIVIKALVERTGIDPERIEDVVFGHAYGSGEAPALGRWCALNAGLPISVAGMEMERRCGSGLMAISTAAMMVQTGAADVVIAGGAESMSNCEFYSTTQRWGSRAGSVTLYDRLERGRVRSQPEWRFGVIRSMMETADNLAKDYGITREEADEYAVRSQQRAAAAWAEGKFANELVPVPVPQRKGDPIIFDRDEGIRGDSSMEALAKLRVVHEGGVTTAGNSSQQNDAASACLVVAEDLLDELKLEPMAFFVNWALAGCEPSRMGIGPVPATEKLLRKTGLSLDQMDLVELNEAFAAQVLAVLKGWNWHDPDKFNVNGSGISLGHPIGATGGRILATMLNELERRKGRYALETMCIGGGQGIAAIFERA
ncbi:acetyl-CoA C-acetyltransferase [Sphingobium wenxiniae]|uniref:Acetyl-CoA C-acetyltransferase n=1 Tax=Sphingobium wenxiniae (strain DSM 21828 / CGMCC 1.7748 / JZ-1) TaxID=595605 RepID=A0A562KMM6_SPHWJ|nr:MULTISPECIES: acetyl-CoA C-acetyltransferase [Sphingobium]KMS61312.1 acetyl-CoA acetyltransferase [Sphingobium baderi LL03]MBB6191906.1 acetyl-CoA C-acetyltransferase [Sphingobium wenxiniae]TWH96669.1 acetyl-CoA C-acetyltransferase [Sphingobium wenxiniae]WRD75530.1 acetyl-CoA C-acetyltransferase [Sphingobium baderi]